MNVVLHSREQCGARHCEWCYTPPSEKWGNGDECKMSKGIDDRFSTYTPLSVNTEYFSDVSVGGRTLTTEVWCGFSISVTTYSRPFLSSTFGVRWNTVPTWRWWGPVLGCIDHWLWEVHWWNRAIPSSNSTSPSSTESSFFRSLEHCCNRRSLPF